MIAQQLKTNKKVLDKNVAQVLNIKVTTLAGMKRKDKLYLRITITINLMFVRYCLMKFSQFIDHPRQTHTEDGKVRIKYFRSLSAYSRYFCSELVQKIMKKKRIDFLVKIHL